MTNLTKSEIESPLDAPCTYCGATPRQTGRALENDHFVPKSVGGSDAEKNRVQACHVCNAAKSGRQFDTIEEARHWLHEAYWSGKRQRWNEHRKIAFGGVPPQRSRPQHPNQLTAEELSMRLSLTELRRSGLRKHGPEAWEEPFTREEWQQVYRNRLDSTGRRSIGRWNCVEGEICRCNQ